MSRRWGAPELFDSVFACDWGVVTDAGAVVFNPGKPARRPEACPAIDAEFSLVEASGL